MFSNLHSNYALLKNKKLFKSKATLEKSVNEILGSATYATVSVDVLDRCTYQATQ